ncbi:MAG: 50S ribosomal protein L10 [Candidatus Shapirobacteria bacterium]|nr:50S ribosomal protein L10 [Candidatus Shapirobacteria bacterium]
MTTQLKINQVEDVAKKISAAKSVALVQYQGLNAADTTDLRANIKNVGGSIEVVKNSLLTRALEKLGIKLPEELVGPTAVTYCNEDEVAPLKEIDKINKAKEKTSFKYGIFDKQLLSLDELKTFLSLPSKSTLITQFVGGLKHPLQRLAYALRFNQTQLVLTLKALSDKKQ